ncbi:16S rRNA (adenine(1518)-N(6)/adenine(1519)-N(6))-dimethyltransferase RsmA [Candidatus Legionella polyplacis]|uniref:Ribosomal RNA small subunit methyltransferase A n=1 Tax=Candidatus Legionella polyplacis TaxID=2005262 RepID=A0ABZ2H156_9GAMM
MSKQYRHIYQKKFGQNFLKSKKIIKKILHLLNINPKDKTIEIGPGLGAITKYLLKKLNQLIAIDIDKTIQKPLLKLPYSNKLKLIIKNALDIDYSQWGKNLHIVGNLPYNISIQLLIYLIKYKKFISTMHFMIQKEVALRLIASPSSKKYGQLTIIMQYNYRIQYLFTVKPENFSPKPKVTSSMIKLIPYSHPLSKTTDYLLLNKVIKKAFSTRRKTLLNNFKPILKQQHFIKLQINPKLRPEQIDINDYIKITNFIKKYSIQCH